MFRFREIDHLVLRVVDLVPVDGKLGRAGGEAVPVTSRYGAEGEGPSICVGGPEGSIVELKGPPGG